LYILQRVGIEISSSSSYDDNEERIGVANPNSMFIQGPKKTVQIWATMINAKKVFIGKQPLYVINCNEPFGPLTFKFGTGSEDYPLLKVINLKITTN
jgi:hypothetical protein